jgi:hypothetical protein
VEYVGEEKPWHRNAKHSQNRKARKSATAVAAKAADIANLSTAAVWNPCKICGYIFGMDVTGLN